MIAHEQESDGLLPPDTWLPLLEQTTRGRLRFVSRHPIAELTGKSQEWVNCADEQRLARRLTELGLVRRRGTGRPINGFGTVFVTAGQTRPICSIALWSCR